MRGKLHGAHILQERARGKAPYAVSFRTHFWDDFVARRFRALSQHVETGDLWVFVDETHDPVNGIGHDRIFRTKPSDFSALGFAEHPQGNVTNLNG